MSEDRQTDPRDDQQKAASEALTIVVEYNGVLTRELERTRKEVERLRGWILDNIACDACVFEGEEFDLCGTRHGLCHPCAARLLLAGG